MLLLDGRPRWETRYVRNLFERGKRWEVNPIFAGPATDIASVPRGDKTDSSQPLEMLFTPMISSFLERLRQDFLTRGNWDGFVTLCRSEEEVSSSLTDLGKNSNSSQELPS